MIDPADPVLACLPADMDLPAFQVQVAPARIIGVVADPGQFSHPDIRCLSGYQAIDVWA